MNDEKHWAYAELKKRLAEQRAQEAERFRAGEIRITQEYGSIFLFDPVPTENPIQPSDACTYKNFPLILTTGVLNSDFLILLPLYGSLPSSLFPCSLLFCASFGTDGGNPRPSPATGHSQPNYKTTFLAFSGSTVLGHL